MTMFESGRAGRCSRPGSSWFSRRNARERAARAKRITTMLEKIRIPNALQLFLKILVSCVLIGITLNFIQRQALLDKLGAMAWLPFLGAAALMYVSIFVCAVRYYYFVANTSELGPARVVEFYFIGHFFNIFLPGGVAGDAIKAFRVTRHGGGKVFSVMTILMERYLGIFALTVLSLFLMFQGGVGERLPPGARFFLYALLYSGLFGYVTLMTGAYRLLNFSDFLKKHLVTNLDFFGSRMLLGTFGLSLLNQGLYLTLNYLLAVSLNIKLDFSILAPIVAVATILSTLPVSFQGLGIREGIFVYLLKSYNVPEEQALLLGLFTFAVNVLVALPGGALFLLEKSEREPDPGAMS